MDGWMDGWQIEKGGDQAELEWLQFISTRWHYMDMDMEIWVARTAIVGGKNLQPQASWIKWESFI